VRLISIHTYPVKGCRRIDHESAVVEPWGLSGDRRWLIINPDGSQVTQREVARLALLRATPTDDGLELSFPGGPSLRVARPAPDPVVRSSVFGQPVPSTAADPKADLLLTAELGRPVRLTWLDDPRRRPVEPEHALPSDRVSFADGYPLLITTQASLGRLNDWIAESGSLEGPLPMTRFRPNVVVDGDEPFGEDRWIGRRITIGSVTFRAPKPCGRCLVTTTDQESGERGREPLRTLARHRQSGQKLLFGVNLIPDVETLPGVLTVGDEAVVS
jgi:uncharacterized protein